MNFTNGTRIFNESEAKSVEKRNKEIWDSFWEIPAKKRTAEDWLKLLDVQFLVKC